MKRNLLSLFLAGVLLLGYALPTFAEEAQPEEAAPIMETVTIETAEDFLLFAQNCTLDTWSQNKQVTLEADINLSSTDFVCIPTFGGEFDGNGHTIQGFDLSAGINPAGLFATLQSTAYVHDLKVTGTVAPHGDAAIAGGIVGTNYGTVESCTFTGTVEGNSNTGGIAGINHGTLRSCRSEGSLQGKNRTGGIAGDNEGAIENCSNRMAVNTTSVDPTIDPTQIDLDLNLDISKLSSLDTTSAAMDTGGIAGYSCGTVAGCTNYADVGYPSIGYNLGGILGRNSGFVDTCRNEGHIMGRKDVGGIVGQMEPEVDKILSPDYLDTLSNQFEQLGNLVSSAGSHAASAGGEVQSCIQDISAYGNSARSALEAFGDSLSSGQFPPSTDPLHTVASSIQGMVSATNALKEAVSDSVGTLSADVNAISAQIGSISKTFALATEDAQQDAVSDVSQADIENIRQGKVFGCTNTGTVEADMNTGGIVGNMGLEYSLDPEDDTLGGSTLQLKRYELKAVIQNCKNLGTITGKRSYVGGICGRMSMGMITACQGYGTISSASGNYVGGIAGITGGTVSACFAKCALSGEDYLGGIVGSGTTQDATGGSSTVTGCYSMVEIPTYRQYIGAISGCERGGYAGNYFFSDTLAGINGISYTALAEPISYEALLQVETLPQDLQTLTLTFLAEGEILKSQTFSFGDSFGTDVFPQIPEKEGFYARWDTTDLTSLHFDTVVTAEYFPLITALSSANTRADGNPVLFAQGQFQEGDTLLLSPGNAGFSPKAGQQVMEHWRVNIPADGLDTHTLRYLPTDDVQIYLLKNGTWSQAETEEIGSYLAFSAAGAEVEFVAVRTGFRWQYLLVAAVGLLLIPGIFLIFRRKKGHFPHKKRAWIIGCILLLLAAAIGCLLLLPQTRKAVDTLRAYDILKAYTAQPEQSMTLLVEAKVADQELSFTAEIHRTSSGQTPVTIISESGRTLYYGDGVVFLEDGSAWRLNSDAPDYSRLLEQLTQLYSQVDVEAVDGVYTLTISEDASGALLELLLPAAKSLLSDTNRLTVDLGTDQGVLTQIHFTGAGNLADSVNTPFSVTAQLSVLSPAPPEIPEAVAHALSSGDYQAQNVYSDDLMRLVNVWRAYKVKAAFGSGISVSVDCGPLQLSENFQFYQWKTENTLIYGIEKADFTLYLTDSAVCDAQGRAIQTGGAETVDVATVLDLVYESFKNADFQCRQTQDGYLYTVSLNPEGMQTLMTAVLPKSQTLDIHYSTGAIDLLLTEDSLKSIQLTCGGSVKVALVNANVSLSMELTPLEDSRIPSLPEAVISGLAPDSP